MTKFADQLFDDLMREHGSTLTHAVRPAPGRHVATRRTLLAVGGGGVAVAAAAGVLVATVGGNGAGRSGDVAGGKTPDYAVTSNPNGTVTLAVYKKSGIAGANAKLHDLGDSQVYVVPVEAGCPSISSLPAPAVPLNGKHPSVQSGRSIGGSVTVNAQGIPAGDILVVGFETTVNGKTITSFGSARLTSAPAPSCVSLPAPPAPPAPPAGPTVSDGSGSGPGLSTQG
jgi:hypothetical protein